MEARSIESIIRYLSILLWQRLSEGRRGRWGSAVDITLSQSIREAFCNYSRLYLVVVEIHSRWWPASFGMTVRLGEFIAMISSEYW